MMGAARAMLFGAVLSLLLAVPVRALADATYADIAPILVERLRRR